MLFKECIQKSKKLLFDFLIKVNMYLVLLITQSVIYK
jgi:hypothetical protein